MAGEQITQHVFLGEDITNVGRGYILPGTTGAVLPFATATVRINGLNQILAALGTLPKATMQRAGFAMRMEMSAILADARQNYVPVDKGKLQRSGAKSDSVKGPMFLGNGKVRVEGSFGPVQNKYGSNYAVPVHEIPEPPGKSVSGHSARHSRGQWKYLQTPFLKRVPDIPGNVARKVNAQIGQDLQSAKDFGALVGAMKTELAGTDDAD